MTDYQIDIIDQRSNVEVTLEETTLIQNKADGPQGAAGTKGDKGDKGDKGNTGDRGPQGPSTIAIGTTTTGNAGTPASVKNSGTAEDVVLDFTIPQGAAGGIQYGDALFVTNPFGGRGIYQSYLENNFALANERWAVTGQMFNQADDTYIKDVGPAALFDPNFESSIVIPAGQYLKVTVDFGGKFVGYPYGKFFISCYYQRSVTSAKYRLYTEYPSGPMWVEQDFVLSSAGTTNLIWEAPETNYQPQTIEFIMVGMPAGTTTPNNGEAWVVGLDWYQNRPGIGDTFPVMRTNIKNTVYRDIAWNGQYGPVINSPDGSAWRIKVSNTGALTAVKI